MATIAETIDDKYGSLSKFAEQVWASMTKLPDGKDPWPEVTTACQELLGDDQGQQASDLLREMGYFSIVLPD